MRSEKGQKEIDKWFDNIPLEVANKYLILKNKTKNIQTFDLISLVSHYNHLHNSEKYEDYREDRNFFIPEVLSLLCLKNNFINESKISKEDLQKEIAEIQELLTSYCALKSMANRHSKKGQSDPISEIAELLSIEATSVRNPGHPDHHLLFSEKLFAPIQNDLIKIFGFSVSDSIIIRSEIQRLISHKCNEAFDSTRKKITEYSNEIYQYKARKKINSNSDFTQEQLIEYSKHSKKEIKNGISNLVLNDVLYSFSTVYTFSAKELSEWTKIELNKIESFLKVFSCEFPSLKETDEIYGPITLLKKKPILFHNEKYLLPSLPLLTWAVEDIFENEIKKIPKLLQNYNIAKHEFLLNQGLEYFKLLLPTANILPANLFYSIDNKQYETDGIIIYDKTLFIIEAKGHRITEKSKRGNKIRTEDHLKDIVRDSYNQSMRTLKYIEENNYSVFTTSGGKQFTLNRKDFDDIITVSLVLEPIGNLSMEIKATNEIGYFKEKHFPWIISLYDLVIFADMIENPFCFIHYIKRRKIFLSNPLLSTYEEIDLLAYYMSNGLYFENTLKKAKEKDITNFYFASNTDEINDYYMYKFGHKKKITEKPKWFMPKEFNDFLLSLDKSELNHRVKMGLLLLEFNVQTIKQFMDMLTRNKAAFSQDKKLHDCSITTENLSGLGFTMMNCIDKAELDIKLYSRYKINQLNMNCWIGLGDTSTNPNTYSFESVFFAYLKVPNVD